MRENTLKSIWARGEAVVNGWLSIPSSFSAEVMAHQGFDSLTVDKHPERAYVNSAYLHAIQQAGGVPVPLPPQLSLRSLEAIGASLRGLLLTGGGDVDPSTFGEAPHPTLYEVAAAGEEQAVQPAREAQEGGAGELGRQHDRYAARLLDRVEIGGVDVRALRRRGDGDRRGDADERGATHGAMLPYAP